MFQFPGFASRNLCIQLHDDRASPRPGSPIRTPTDQRSLAAPRGFSQLATSFFAVLCPGIHPAPLSLDPFYLISRKDSPHYALSALHNNLSPQFVKKQPPIRYADRGLVL